MQPNLKRFVAGAVAIALLWAVASLSGADQITDSEQPSGQIAAETDRAPVAEEGTETETAPVEATGVRYSDLTTIAPGDLPIEAIDTLDLIASGGPYPYSKDDSVFQNREGILPDHERGHYREYSVDTPGESDRGARRIVAGAEGALYYTDDHYDSFREIVFGQ